MKNLLSKMGRFFESHVEKLVLIVSLLICFWLLVTCVAISPNRVEYGGQKFSPAGVDDDIYTRQVDPVSIIVNGKPRPMDKYESRLDGFINPNDPVREGIKGPLDKGFMSLFASPIGYIDDEKRPSIPKYSTTTEKVDKRAYRLPVVGHIDNVDIEHIRAAAYVPVEPLREDLSYTEAKHALHDVDIVTVQGSFNMALLVSKFHECFADEDLPETWRDPVLGKPVFAAVHLQRQRQLDNDQWGVWEDVPRCGTEQHQELFHIVEQVATLPPGGVKVRMLQYGRPDIMADLLQPLPYQIASPYEEWFPPALHREFLSVYEKQKIQERRANREERADQDQGTDRRSLRGRGTGMQDTRMRGGDTRGDGGMPGYSMEDTTTTRGAPARGRRGPAEGSTRMTDTGGRGATRTRRPEMGMEDVRGMGLGYEGDMMEESAVREVYDKLFEIFITPQMDIYQQQEIVVWAHDDTLGPGHTYRYRMRLGVFNPVAGTRYLADAYQDKADAVILWSEFSEITRPVEIPARQYFFANKYYPETDVLAMEVAQFVLGYWHIGKFQIKPGEVLGQVKEETSDDTDNTRNDRRTSLIRDLPGPVASQDAGVTEMIDYSTGIIWIGVESVDGWLGDTRLRRQPYYQMLYTDQGTDLQRVPIGTSNWSATLSNIYNEINRTRRESSEAPRAFGSGMDSGVNLFDYREGTGSPYGRDAFGIGY